MSISVNRWNIFHYIALIAWNKFHLFLYQAWIDGKQPLDFSIFYYKGLCQGKQGKIQAEHLVTSYESNTLRHSRWPFTCVL